jgi:hypothetical protein
VGGRNGLVEGVGEEEKRIRRGEEEREKREAEKRRGSTPKAAECGGGWRC